MGTQSKITPIQFAAYPLQVIGRRIARCGVAILLVIGLSYCGLAAAQGTALPLVLPSAIAYDAQGNLYFADSETHVIHELSTAGAITAVAGTGVQGFSGDGGPAIDAELDSPAGLAVDGVGNLYIADSHNHCVRKVEAASGTITTIAGTGSAGYGGDGGSATAAQLDLPTALAFDSTGDLYIADTNNHRVRRIVAGTGLISTIAGNGVEAFAGDGGLAKAASIDLPNGLALDAAGNLYIADTHNGRVREVNAVTGLISTVAGTGVVSGNVQTYGGDGGVATAAGLALPRGLTMDSAGSLYVADSENHRIRQITAAGAITTVAGQGTETFSGDGAPAVTASLDSPRSVAISPGGLPTLADTGNQRIRQVDSLPAPGPDIHTIAGVGLLQAETLTLSGPSTVVYGGGSLTANFLTGTVVTGSVTLLDTSSASAVSIGTASLSGGAATFSVAGLAAGWHSIVATFAGDATHAAAQSAPLALTVTPLGLTATATPVSITYGQAVPALSGSWSGELPQDAAKVAATFSSAAGLLSPAGSYPITVALTGVAAGNYTVVLTPASVTIAKAATVVTLLASATSLSLGMPVTVTAHAVSSTSGTPTGSIALLDGSTTISVVPLSGGAASFTTSALALGTHTLTATYSGDPNFLPSTSEQTSIVVGPGSDFSLASVGQSMQSAPAGSTATFNFSIETTGPALASPIILAVQGLPVGATASLSPASIPPGGAVTSFALTIQTPMAKRNEPARQVPGWPGSGVLAVLLLPAMGWAGRSLRKGRGARGPVWSIALFALLLGSLVTGCGDRINTAPEDGNAKSYTLTVTGTATSPAGTALQHSVNVTLNVL